MTLLHAFLLGIIQGLTEFIPVSSTAHLLISEHLLGIPANEATFAFSVLVQLGTIISLVIFFWKDLLTIAGDTLKSLKNVGRFNDMSANAKTGWYIIIATVPALAAGVLLKDMVEMLFKMPLIESAIRLFAAALLLTTAETAGKKTREMASMTWKDALFVGVMQILAIFPGASRSGTTISAGMFRGFNRPAAARFAFLMSVPVMLAAGAYESLSLLNMPGLTQFLPLLLVGFITAAVVGWLAIRWLLDYLNRHSLYVFAAYCAVIGSICLVLNFIK